MRFFLLLGGFALAISPSHTLASAQSQDSAVQALLACQAIENNEERLKCLDAATKRLAGEAEAAPQPEVTPVAPIPVAPQPVPEPTASERAALETERAALAAERAALEAEKAELAEAQEAEEEGSGIPVWARLRQTLSQNPDVPNEFSINVTKITRNNIGRHFFYTEEGYVWEQVELEDFRPPARLPATARIKRGALGSQRIVFDDRQASSHRVRPDGEGR